MMRIALLGLITTLCPLNVAANLADPTLPPNYRAAANVELPKHITDWRVLGITISGKAASAIVNNQVVVKGQTIGEATVIEITPTKVVLDYAGQRVDVLMQTRTVKRLHQQ